jgi:ribonuclease R
MSRYSGNMSTLTDSTKEVKSAMVQLSMPRRQNHRRSAKAEAPKKHLTGIVELTRKGTGYLPWPNEPEKEDIEIFPEKLNGALNGDTVEVELLTLFPRPRGRVKKVVARAKEEFVCTIEKGRAVPHDMKFPMPIDLIENNFEDGEKVLVKLLSFGGTAARGEVLEHLGKAGEHRVEMNAIVMEHGFKIDFPAEAKREAQEIEKNHASMIAREAPRRVDYRDTPTMTIDPVDAKDFDDALSVVELPNGEIEVGVHIADATHFVREGMAIDQEMARRGTSVYLVDATIPMLPHELSGNVCSLRPDEDRLAFSAVFRMNKNGEVLSRKFEKSIIRSQKRFTYEKAQGVLDTQQGPMLRELNLLRSLARIMRKAREQKGAIDFGDNEVRFELDAHGKPLAVRRKVRIETNLLIEEFMLLANREVATFIADLAKKVPEKNLVFLYRIHDTPKEDRIEELATFVRAIGYDFNKKRKHYSARDISKLLAQIEGKPEAALIRTATLRSMAKAIYSTKNIGHFGLAFEYYTHFTSPIRRYPDMLVHRILASHLNGKPVTRREYGHLEKLCIDASLREAEAAAAERESIKYKLVEYMQSKVGQECDAIISGVTDWGIYVEDKASSAEGLVRVATMGGDYFNYSAKEYALVGQKTKKKYALGDEVRVRLVSADLGSRQLDFELA